LWLTQQRRKREPITETLLQERALILPSQEVSEREPDLTPNRSRGMVGERELDLGEREGRTLYGLRIATDQYLWRNIMGKFGIIFEMQKSFIV